MDALVINELHTMICYMCGDELNDKNISAWEVYIDENFTTSPICLMCSEINSRELTGAIKKGDEIIPIKSREEILKEIKNEGWTIEKLKIKEEMEIRMLN